MNVNYSECQPYYDPKSAVYCEGDPWSDDCMRNLRDHNGSSCINIVERRIDLIFGDEFEKVEENRKWFYICQYLILIPALVLNLLAIIAVIRARLQLYGQGALIISLLCSEVLVCLYQWLPRLFYMSHRATVNKRIVHEIEVMAASTTYFINFLNIAALSVDVAIAVHFALNYKKIMSKRRVKILIAVIWLFGIIFGLQKIFFWNPVVYLYDRNDPSEPYFNWLVKKTEFGFIIYVFGAITIFVMLLLVGIYGKMYLEIRRQNVNKTGARQRDYKEKSFVTCGLIIGSFAVFCTPWLWVYVYKLSDSSLSITPVTHRMYKAIVSGMNISNWTVQDSYDYDSNLDYAVKTWIKQHFMVDFCRLLLWLNTLADPLIYALRMRSVRGNMIDLVCCCRKTTYKDRRRRKLAESFSAAPSERKSTMRTPEGVSLFISQIHVDNNIELARNGINDSPSTIPL